MEHSNSHTLQDLIQPSSTSFIGNNNSYSLHDLIYPL